MKPKIWKFEDIKIGYEIEPIAFSFSEKDIDVFAKLSGDENPLHVSAEFAQKKGFNGRVAHGMFLSSKFSYLVGMVLPGRDSLYLSQEVRFHKPVYAEEDLFLGGRVINKSEATRIVEIAVEILNKDREVLVGGTAKVKVI